MSTAYTSKNWKAWHDTMPGSPPTLHVKGEVTCPTSGYSANLVPRVPQGINPAIYIMDLEVTPPGEGTVVHQTVTDVPVHYSEDTDVAYGSIDIQPEGITVEVGTVS